MTYGAVFIPSPGSEYVELAKSRTGQLFTKQILGFGRFVHPGDKNEVIDVTPAFAQTLVDNFHNGACDIVQVPIVNEKNQHVEDPLRNLGEVVDLTVEKDGVYATIDARKPEYAKELGKTLLGASAMMHLNYDDTKTGKKVGPTLLHVAVTNRPYLTNLAPYSEIVAASADSIGDEDPVMLTSVDYLEAHEMEKTKDELIAELKDKFGVDVVALSAAIDDKPPIDDKTTDNTSAVLAALSNVLNAAGAQIPRSDDGSITTNDVAEAVIELAREKAATDDLVATLKAESDALKLSAAEAEVATYVRQGKILPAQKEVMLEIRLSNPAQFEKLIPDAPLVEMSARGVEVHDAPASERVETEVARYADLANAASRSGRKRA